jgi:hypothetical protein
MLNPAYADKGLVARVAAECGNNQQSAKARRSACGSISISKIVPAHHTYGNTVGTVIALGAASAFTSFWLCARYDHSGLWSGLFALADRRK